MLIPNTYLAKNESNGAVAREDALERKRSRELVIHITSVGEISFLVYFTIFPHLQFTIGEFENFTAGSLKISLCRLLPPALILANINLFGSLVFLGFLLVVCSKQLMQWDRNTAGRLERLSAQLGTKV